MSKDLNNTIADNYEYFLKFANKYLKNENDAEDVVQNAVVYMLQRAKNKKLEPIKNYKSYMLQLIKCRSLDLIKYNSLRTYLDNDILAEYAEDKKFKSR